MTMPEPDEDLTADAQDARAELEQLKRQPGFRAIDHQEIYERAYPGPAEPSITDALMPAAPRVVPYAERAQEAARQQIEAIRKDANHPAHRTGTVEGRKAHEQLMELYRVAYPGSANPDEDVHEPVLEAEFAPLPEVPEQTWDAPSLVRTYDSAARLGVSREAVSSWVQRGLDQLAGTAKQWDDAEAAQEFRRRWGGNAERVLDDARRVFRWIGSPGLERFLNVTALGNDPDLIQTLAQYAGRLPGGGTPQEPPKMGSHEALRAYQRVYGSRGR